MNKKNTAFLYKVSNIPLLKLKIGGIVFFDIFEFLYKKYASLTQQRDQAILVKVAENTEFKMICNSSRGFIDIKLIWYKIYEAEISKIFVDLLKKDDIFIDVGANIGYFTLLAAKIAKSGNIYAFEPVSETFKLLKQNLSINNITIEGLNNLALGSLAQEISIPLSMEPGLNSIVNKRRIKVDKDTETIKVARFDDLYSFKEKEIFIKVDVEGYEFEALKGMRNLLSNNNCKIVFEFTPFFFMNLNKDYIQYACEFLNYLKSFNFKLFLINPDGSFEGIDHIRDFVKNKSRKQNNLIAIK